MCQPYKHEDLKLGEDHRWNCQACGNQWEYGHIPLVVLEIE